MEISPDNVVIWRFGGFALPATLLFTWLVAFILAGGAWLVTRRLDQPQSRRWRNLLETLVDLILVQLREIAGPGARAYLPFIGTLYLFIAVANLLSCVPGYLPPTGSLSTTAALALCVFFAVPAYTIAQRGIRGYLKHYIEPTVLMLPFHLLGEVSRTIALAVRLFGNVMSGTMAVAIFLTVAPFFFPVAMQVLELLIGQVQAYIFAVLATVYIASAAQTQERSGSAPARTPPGTKASEVSHG